MDVIKLHEYETLSPFEIKDILIDAASETARAAAITFLNAGRGNPNWVATTARDGFFLLGQFAMTESRRTMDHPAGLGGMPAAPGIAVRFTAWLDKQKDMPGAAFLTAMLPFAIEKFGFAADEFIFELTDSIIGDHYPEPDRMLVHNECVVHEYLQWAICGTPRPAGRFDLYAVEGGTAAICYLFKSLKANRLLNPGDTIALATPIFTPYLEIPALEDYGLNIVYIQADQEHDFQFTPQELAKLEDPAIKAFFLVNPGNPSAVALRPEVISQIADLIARRPSLFLITDDVYGTFLQDFRGLLGALPRNTIGVYSYSKYFGCTGWRLGVIAIHENNIFDELIAKHPAEIQHKLDQRYASLSLTPRAIKFIDRIVADSRDVALNHTAGLSLPQQVQMTLFSLSELMDLEKSYQSACMAILERRVDATIKSLGITLKNETPYFDHYYGLIDFEYWIAKYLGEELVAWMKEHVHPLDIVFRLAEDHGIVLLNGSGFHAPDWSVRVSFANLDDKVYSDIGRAVRAVARNYLQAFLAARQLAKAKAQAEKP